MKNTRQTKRTKRNAAANNETKRRFARLKDAMSFTRLKLRSRQALSAFFIYALVFVPLLSIPNDAHAQLFNCFFTPDASAMFQGCSLGNTMEYELTERAIDDVMELYNLPRSDRERVMRYGRNEIRARLYVRLLELVHKESPTDRERAAAAGFARFVQKRRISAARAAKAEYDKWNGSPCRYAPPAPYTYSPPTNICVTTGLAVAMGGAMFRHPPSFDEFVQFGAARAYGDLQTPEAQDASRQTTIAVVHGSSAAALGVAGAAGIAAGIFTPLGALTPIIPFAAVGHGINHMVSGYALSHFFANTSASGTGALAVGGPVIIVSLAIVIFAQALTMLVDEKNLPGKLDEYVNNAENSPVDVRALADGDDAAQQEFYGAFLAATLPDFPDTSISPPEDTDRKFVVADANGSQIKDSIVYRDWDDKPHFAQLRGGWFVDAQTADISTTRQRLAIQYRDWNNEKWQATRHGTRFILTKADAENADGAKTDEIKMLDGAGNRVSVRIKVGTGQMTVHGDSFAFVDCAYPGSESYEEVPVNLGKVSNPNDPPAALTVLVNNQSSVTVGNFRFRDLHVDGDYNIIVKVLNDQPVSASNKVDVTVKVRNTLGHEESFTATLSKSAARDYLSRQSAWQGAVGENFTAHLTPPNLFEVPNLCFIGSRYSTSGELPPGVSLTTDANNNLQLTGTPTTSGKYTFTLSRNYTNGESFSRTYVVTIKGTLAQVPDGMTSWWRGEANAEDYTDANDGAMVGSARFNRARVGAGFEFDGANGYVKLPNDTFTPGQTFSFETWFKTDAAGVILGQQPNNAAPYASAPGATSELIGVQPDGSLRVNMFGGAMSFAGPVNDNKFHHLAVTYDHPTRNRTLYVDGVQVATANAIGVQTVGANYQFGTGFARGAWSNFKGLIDEPTLYNTVLSAQQIGQIFRAGDGGKVIARYDAVAPRQSNQSSGALFVSVTGGEPTYQYSIDNGQTFQDTGVFVVASGTYSVVIKDGADRTLQFNAVVPDPPIDFHASATGVNATCKGANNGKITLLSNATNPTAADRFLFSIDGGRTTYYSGVFTNLRPGTYYPVVRHEGTGAFDETQAITLTEPEPLAMTPNNFNRGAAVGYAFNQTFIVSGGTPMQGQARYNLTVTGNLPPGLSVTNRFDNNVVISGTPTQTGTYPITITATDGNSCPLTRNLTLTVYPNGCRVKTVQNALNTGAGSLRQAIADACPEAEITVPNTISRINLTSALTLDKTLTIKGAGADKLTISGGNVAGVFVVKPDAIVNLSGMTIADGNVETGGGGGIGNAGTLYLFGVNVANNRAASGGGIYNTGTLEIYSSAVAGNFASGNSAGIFNGSNHAATIVNSTIANNVSNGEAGGIANFGALNLTYATVAGNRSNADGVDDNNSRTDGGGIVAYGSETLVNTIVAGNFKGTVAAQTPNDIGFGTVESAEYSLFGDAATAGGVAHNASGNTVGNSGAGTIPIGSILSSTLALNGGTTPNFALAGNSLALDKGKATGLRTGDQRGLTRTVDNASIPNAAGGNGSDIGAVETQNNELGISGRVTNGGHGLANVVVTLSGSVSNRTATTDAAGDYSFGNLTGGGNYTVTPALGGYTFNNASLNFNNMNGSVGNADFSTSAVSYEGDIAARPTGNGTIDVFDLVALGRIVGKLDADAAHGGEFQRADVSPFETRGDGAVNVQDLVQIGNYVGNLYPKTPATGAARPNSSANSSAASLFEPDAAHGKSSADKLFGASNAALGGLKKRRSAPESSAPSAPTAAALGVGAPSVTSTNAVVPINLTSNADTAAIQFTVTYDAAKLSVAGLSAITNRAPNTTFVINNNTPGKLGVVAYQPLDGSLTFPANTVKLFDINFTVARGASGSTSIGFGGDPVPIAASNPQAGAVGTSSAGGSVTLLAPTAATVSLGGRVLVGKRGLGRAVVTLVAPNGEKRMARTTPLGYYRFRDIAAGESYIVSVSSKRYAFNPQTFNAADNLDELNFSALP